MTLRKTEEIFGLILIVNLKPDEKKRKMIFQSVTQAAQRKKSVYPQQESNLSVPNPDLEIRGGGEGSSLLDPPLPMTIWLLIQILDH